MSTLYVDRKGIQLKVTGGALEFHEPSGRRGSVPLNGLERVVLRGQVSLSTSVLGAITEAGAGVLVLSGRQGRRLAVCVGRPHNDVLRRIGQYDAYSDTDARVDWSRRLVLAKVQAQGRLLRRALEARPDRRRPLLKAMERLDSAASRLSSNSDESLHSLLGVEGAAAAAYFAAYATLLPPSLGFERRQRRPPTDPVNACLSLAYSLLHFEAVAACHGTGLDPLLGLYHEPAYGRESLAADAIEPFRPHVDEWVWSLFRERVLAERGFRNVDGAVLLDKSARQRFYKRFNPFASAVRRLLRRQLGRVARDFERRARENVRHSPAARETGGKD